MCRPEHTVCRKKLIIHDEEDPVIDFSWFYYISRAKLGLTHKEAGRITLTLFNRLYKQYQHTWGLEMRMTQVNMTYEDLHARQMKDEEWF